MPNLGDFDNKVKRSEQLEERLSDIELGHKTEKVKTMKMMESTVEFFLEIMKKKLRMRKMKIWWKEKLKKVQVQSTYRRRKKDPIKCDTYFKHIKFNQQPRNH